MNIIFNEILEHKNVMKLSFIKEQLNEIFIDDVTLIVCEYIV